MSKSRQWIVPILVILAVARASDSKAYDLRTHEAINVGGTLESALDTKLRNEIGFSSGLEELILDKRVIDWIREGGRLEDRFLRFLNHFHHPLRSPWRNAGLADFPGFGTSSILWGQSPDQEFSWIKARQAYNFAFTLPSKAERERKFADIFRALGQVMHLIADVSVPAHVRNDQHAGGDPYEEWVELQAKPRPGETLDDALRRFLGTFAPSPTRPDSFILKLPIFGQDATDAPVPIARFWDTDQYDGTNPSFTLSPRIGITEYANANFFSHDTVFADQKPPHDKHYSPFPSSADVEVFVDPANNRKYWRKRAATPDEPQRLAERLATVSKRNAEAETAGVVLEKRGRLDDKVHEDYARLLLPRAVGYSTALLDYFFRGKLDVDLIEDLIDPSVVRVEGVNASSDPLVEGTLTLHADGPDGLRRAATALEPTTLAGVGPGQALRSARFQAPEDAERFVAVYQGTLGAEAKAPDRNFPGGVIGKVLGGVRVEEVFEDFFEDGTRWFLRTPQGVFPLPILTSEVRRLKWGDADNTLVGRSTLGPGQPNLVFAFEIARPPGSAEVPLRTEPDGSRVVDVRVVKQVPFPHGMDLGTTVEFTQTLHFTQKLFKFTVARTFEWKPGYTLVKEEVGPLQIDPVLDESPTFSLSFPVQLDLRRSRPYFVDLEDLALDTSGRLLALVQVDLTSPGGRNISFPSVSLNPDGTLRVLLSESFLEFSFPFFVNPLLWALVDLERREVVASTAEPVIRIAFDRAIDLTFQPPPSFDSLAWTRTTTTLIGGPDAGTQDSGWFTVGLRELPTAEVVAEVREDFGVPTLAATGQLRSDLQQEAARLGFGDFQLSPLEGPSRVLAYFCGTLTPCQGIRRITMFTNIVVSPPVLAQARRARPAPAGERLVFLSQVLAGGFRPGPLLVWAPEAGRAETLQLLADSFHSLGPVTGATVMLFSFSPFGFRSSSLIPLDGAAASTVFPNVFLGFPSFTLLHPNRLYHLEDLRFYRPRPPLQRTALPARLAPASFFALFGDFHAVTLP